MRPLVHILRVHRSVSRYSRSAVVTIHYEGARALATYPVWIRPLYLQLIDEGLATLSRRLLPHSHD